MLDCLATLPVEALKGEYVRRNNATSGKVYIVVGYCREMRKYQLDDVNDASRSVYVKKGTLLHAGFTY